MRRAVILWLCALAAACGGGRAFSLSASDNDQAALARALAVEKVVPPPVGQALAYLALADGRLAAFDLSARKIVWAVPAQVGSRVVVCGAFVTLHEGTDLVGRDAADGHELWRRPVGTVTGLAGDSDRAYVVEEGSGAWRATAVDRAGAVLWSTETAGRLGPPAARGGLLYLPFLDQWLHLVDGATGATLARLRQKDEAVSWVRATSDGVFFGARSVLLLDERAAAGTREPGRHAPLPETIYAHFPGLLAHLDDVAYSARDRVRILWRASRSPLGFRDGIVVLVAYRVFFGVDAATGNVRWARLLGRHDVVAADDTGGAIAYITSEGELGALDRRTGDLLGQGSAGARVVGATFQAEAYRPGGESQPAPPTDDTLAAIALDRDARLGPVKLFAVASLGRRDATPALLRVITGEGVAPDVARAAGAALLKGSAGEGALVEALRVHTDVVAGTTARAVDVIARALAARRQASTAVVEALVGHLEDPATGEPERRAVAAALGALGGRDSAPALRSFLLLHRCDARFAGSLEGVIDALVALGGEREVLRHVAAADDTAGPVKVAIENRLGGERRP